MSLTVGFFFSAVDEDEKKKPTVSDMAVLAVVSTRSTGTQFHIYARMAVALSSGYRNTMHGRWR